MTNAFNLCPMCGSKNIENPQGRKWVCPDCGFDLYNNTAAAVAVIFYDDFNNVLFEVRGKEPGKGFLGLPGGFIDFDESAEDGAKRECMEEISFELLPQKLKYLGSFPNTYVYKNVIYKTCDIYFLYKIDCDFKDTNDFLANLKAQKSEVASFTACQIKNDDDLEKLSLAFESSRKSLERFLEKYKSGEL